MDFEVPAQTRELVELARDFGRKRFHEAETTLDRVEDPVEAFTSDTSVSIRHELRKLGLHLLDLPEQVGGVAAPFMASHFVNEELAAAGPGLACAQLVDGMAARLIAAMPGRHPVLDDYLEQFVDDVEGVHSSAWALTEPDVGSDVFTFGSRETRMGARARRTPGGGGWILDGAKSAWCTNGWLADMFCVMASVDPDTGMEGTGTFLVPASWPGVSKGRPISKVGLRALNQCDVVFEGVEVPGEFLVFPPGAAYRDVLDSFTSKGNAQVGGIALGVAQSAYELGLAYAKERRQGGRPIVEHQLVAKKLFDAHRGVESARLMLRRSAWCAANRRRDTVLAYAARVTASETASRVTADMMFLHGGNGITREYEIEKLWRDSAPLQIADGTTDRVALKAAALL